MKKLYIEEVEPEEDSRDCVNYEVIDRFYDIVSSVGVTKIKLDIQLEVDKIYEFNFVDKDDDDTYEYIVLKKEGNIYYIAQYHKKLITTKESLLVEGAWKKINIEELDINLSRFNIKESERVNY